PVDLIVSDVRMPDMDGIEMLKKVREIDGDVGIVMMTAFGTIATAREAFKLGADDFVQKPFNNEELKVIVRRSLERRKLATENRVLKKALRQQGQLSNIIGSSKKMRELFDVIEQIAGEESTILISGESGTGKELAARAIHDTSRRANQPFVAINCGAVSETLLESELFGFMKGSFTGAEQNRPGVFEAANGGTIFLDEIGEMPPSMQVKMLRVLQERKVRRIGSAAETEIDVRVIAASNRDLSPMVEAGTFRQDLFYRIAVIPIHIPALRERREDIPELTEHFIRKFSSRSNKAVRLSQDAIEALSDRNWAGNVRELEHTIERAVALTADGAEIGADKCAPHTNGAASLALRIPNEGLNLSDILRCLELDLLRQALSRSGGNHARVAELLHLEPHVVRGLIEKHDIH
nr:sigma-54-dependent Fis family transcriptional regulator [Blastocatellia bacterium]